MQSESIGVNIKPLCTTRWTARHGAILAILKDYSILMETMEEINHTSHDEHGLKAAGILASLEKFSTLFGLELGYLVFGAAETLSNTLQGKDTSIQEAVAAVNLAKSFYKRQRKEEAFNQFYDRTTKSASSLKIGLPSLPRYRRAPRRLDEGTSPHQFSTPKDYFRCHYYQVRDLLLRELEDRFEQSKVLPSVLALEHLLIAAANGRNYEEYLDNVSKSCYKDDFNFGNLRKQLPLRVDVVKNATPKVKEVTSVHTIGEAMNVQNVYKVMLSEVHNMLRLYLTVSITSATSERTFSALKRVFTYLRSSMTEKRLNNCLLLHVHKDLLDTCDVVEVAKEFISAKEERRKYFGAFLS